jgi:hypothetical protein
MTAEQEITEPVDDCTESESQPNARMVMSESAHAGTDDKEGPLCEERSQMTIADHEHPFCFESDHLALRNNSDYHKLLKALGALERQKSQAIQDLEKLYAMEEKALRNPTAFIERLKKDAGSLDKEVPRRQTLTQVPYVHWSAYGSAVQETIALAGGEQWLGIRKGTTSNHIVINSSVNGASEKQSKPPSEGDLVRGRVYSQKKSVSFNQLWTPEEQAKLEKLLVKYPSEQTEAKRWEKIAKEMENRTPKQIASRVQKYFIKLAKAGLPIPGRMPSSAMCKKVKTCTNTQIALHWFVDGIGFQPYY